jgi:hypothetical protein
LSCIEQLISIENRAATTSERNRVKTIIATKTTTTTTTKTKTQKANDMHNMRMRLIETINLLYI